MPFFYITITAIKVVINLIFQKSFTCYETNLKLLFLSFSLARPNQRGIINKPAAEQRQDQDKVRHELSFVL